MVFIVCGDAAGQRSGRGASCDHYLVVRGLPVQQLVIGVDDRAGGRTRHATVQVLVEHGRLTLISEAVEEACKVRPNDAERVAQSGGVVLLTHEYFDAQAIHGWTLATARREG